MSTRRSARLRSSPSRSLALGGSGSKTAAAAVEFDPDEAPTSGSVGDQGPVEDVATSRSLARSLALGAKRQRVEFDLDEAPTSGSLDGQGSVEDIATLNKDRPSNSVINSEEEYLAFVMDELFDPDQTDEALVSLPAPTIPGGCQNSICSYYY